jgi:hypothetical protein
MKFRAIKILCPNDVYPDSLRVTLALEIEPHRDLEYNDVVVTVQKPGVELMNLSLNEVKELAIQRAREVVDEMKRTLSN